MLNIGLVMSKCVQPLNGIVIFLAEIFPEKHFLRYRQPTVFQNIKCPAHNYLRRMRFFGAVFVFRF